ncbi:hypothetical protein KFE25_007348 [Diacronema lutheri]|uniref:Uncharacterized protein n=1 Tax=Diacronema lutheri TaxID=2081491 RepID=A0A8J6CG90_DIALT|nr:hypothetical protein KFE25_007348 [Diacronema lutheri]
MVPCLNLGFLAVILCTLASVGGQPGWAQFVPKGVLGKDVTAQPLINLSSVRPEHASGAWHGVPVNVRFHVADAFKGGFIASVQVAPWVPGALLTLNYTFSDVKVQRIWNGDLLDAVDGTEPDAFALMVGRAQPLFAVRLHNASRVSGPGQLDDAVSFMASGTAQPPGIFIGCRGLPVLSLAVGRRTAAGYRATVTVRPWSVGDLIEIDLRRSRGVTISGVRGADAVRRRGARFVVRLAAGAAPLTIDGDVPTTSSFELCANGPLDEAVLSRLELPLQPAAADGAAAVAAQQPPEPTSLPDELPLLAATADGASTQPFAKRAARKQFSSVAAVRSALLLGSAVTLILLGAAAAITSQGQRCGQLVRERTTRRADEDPLLRRMKVGGPCEQGAPREHLHAHTRC